MRGFRLFFVLAAGFALLWVPLWLLRFAGVLAPPGYPSGAAWHGHEMIYGYIAAVVAGFLTVGMGGWRILLLAGVWLAGRAAMLPDGTAPAVAAALDLLFLPLLAVLRRPPLWSAPKLLTAGVLAILTVLCGLNLWFHGESLAGNDANPPTATAAVLVAVLLSLVGGRLVPGHTRAALRRGPGLTLVGAERFSIAAGALLVLGTAVDYPPVCGAAALALALIQLYRLVRWWDRAILADPLLWILHLGFAWLSIGLFWLGAAMIAGWPSVDLARHAWLIGGAGSLTLGIMTRLALGHTRRPLQAGAGSTAAFILVSVAAVARIAGPLTGYDMAGHVAAAAAWSVAFALFLAEHGRPLLRPSENQGISLR